MLIYKNYLKLKLSLKTKVIRLYPYSLYEIIIMQEKLGQVISVEVLRLGL